MKTLNQYIEEKLVINKNFVNLSTWDGIDSIDTLISIVFNRDNNSFYIMCFKKSSFSTTTVSEKTIKIDDWTVAGNGSAYRRDTFNITNEGFSYEEKDNNFFNVVLEPFRYDKKIKEFIETYKHDETYHYKDILGHFDIQNIDNYTEFFNSKWPFFRFDNDNKDDDGVLRNITNE